MSEQSTTPENSQPEQAKPDFQPITSQEQLNALLGDRLARERAKFADYDELKAKAEKFDEAEKANLSELEKATEANAQLKQELEAFKLKDLRSQVAASKGLSLEAAAHLAGSIPFPKHARIPLNMPQQRDISPKGPILRWRPAQD